jgi:hypothetical protein
LCKGGQQTTTQNTATSADPRAQQAYSDVLSKAQGVASTPYQAYTGELTAPVNAQQQSGIGGINAAAGQAQPSINQALGIASGAANPLTQQQIQNYQNPYTQDVVNATQAQFNNQNAQAQQGRVGNSIAQGALGGNRVGVAQANLAGQQQLAQNPVIAGLYSNSYSQGLATAAQQYQQNPLAAAGSIANFGLSGQNAALTGAGAQLGAGTVQQQTQQQADTANQQAYSQQQAYPYQQTQWLAGIDTGVGPGLGSTSTGQTTAPAPNQFAQYAGLGLAAASFLARGGRVQHMDGGGVAKSPWGNATSWIPSIGMGNAAPHAGSAPGVSNAAAPQFDYSKIIGANNKDSSPGLLSQYGTSSPFLTSGADNPFSISPASNVGAIDQSMGTLSSGVGNGFYGPGFARGGVVGYAEGGAPDDPFGDDNRATAYDLLRKGQGIQAPISIPGGEAPPSQGVAPAVWNPDQPYRMPDQGSVDDWRAGHPLPADGSAPAAPNDDDEALPPEITGKPRAPSPGVVGADTAMSYAATPGQAATVDATQPQPAQPQQSKGMGNLGLFNLSPNARSGLLAAGLGMMSSRSPNFMNAVGEGGLHGLTAYSAANQHDEQVAAEAAKLSREAQTHAEEMKLKTSSQAETARHNKATEEKESKPQLVKDTDPNTGEITYKTFDPNTATLKNIQIPGTDVANKAKYVSQAPPVEERRKAPQASPESRDEGFYKYMQDNRPPGYADIVRGVADYEIDPNKEASLQKGQRDRLYRDVKQYDPTYDQTHFAEKSGVIQNFSRGPASQAVNSLNVSVAHLGTLTALGDALQNGNSPMINKLGNAISVWSGRPAVTNFEAAKEIVGDEVVKAVVGGVNSQADREAIKHLILAQQTPAQLKGVIQTFTTLLGGQLDGQRQRYQAGTGLNNFDQKYLAPATREALERNVKGEVNPAIAKLVYPSGIPQQQSAAPATNAVPPVDQRVIGQTYQTPRGPAKWTAQGWLQ